MRLVAASSTGEASPRKVACRMCRKIERSTIIDCRHQLIQGITTIIIEGTSMDGALSVS